MYTISGDTLSTSIDDVKMIILSVTLLAAVSFYIISITKKHLRENSFLY